MELTFLLVWLGTKRRLDDGQCWVKASGDIMFPFETENRKWGGRSWIKRKWEEGVQSSVWESALQQSGRTMPPLKRMWNSISPPHRWCSGCASTQPLLSGLAPAESRPLLSHTTYLPCKQQECTTPQSMALSLVLAGKSHQVWKPGVLLRGEKKESVCNKEKALDQNVISSLCF